MRSFHKYTCWLNLVLSAAHYIKKRTNIADVCDCLKIDICSLKAIHPACSSCMFYSASFSADPIVVFSMISYGTRTPVRRLRIRYLSHLARHCLFLLYSCFLLNLGGVYGWCLLLCLLCFCCLSDRPCAWKGCP